MLRTAWWTVRQPRYAALAISMFVVAVGCVIAGTWQISRYEQKVRQNDALKANAAASAVPITTMPVPLVGRGPAPSRDAIRYRTVTVSGTYLAGAQQFVRDVSLNDATGYYVLTPLHTSSGVLLVVRGFVADGAVGTGRPAVGPPPSGSVLISGRLQTAGTKDDAARELGHNEIESINPADQASRLAAPVYDAYLTLDAHQPGSAGLRAIAPDLSNPAGGAVESQHLAYIVQWYLFAALALAAPFVMSRSEVRGARERFLGVDPGAEDFGVAITGEGDQRRQLSSGGELVARGHGRVARRIPVSAEDWRRAEHLADRYGRSLGPDLGRSGDRPAFAARAGDRARLARGEDDAGRGDRPHRSHDRYHGAYNDYLWQLALADGTAPSVPGSSASIGRVDGNGEPGAALDRAAVVQPPKIIEGSVVDERSVED